MLNCGARAGRQHRSTQMILPRRGACFHFTAKLPNCPAPALSVAFLRCCFFSSSHNGIPPVVDDIDTDGRQTLAASRDRLINDIGGRGSNCSRRHQHSSARRPVTPTAPSQSTKRRLVLHVCAQTNTAPCKLHCINKEERAFSAAFQVCCKLQCILYT